MNNKLKFIISLLTVIFLAACGPSQAELDATITQVAAGEYMTQTAQAPTSTPTPTNTPLPTQTPTPTLTPTSTKTPKPKATEVPKNFTVETLDNGWSRYSYLEDGFEISLPPNWELLDLSSGDLDQIMLALEDHEQFGNIYSSDYFRSLVAAGIKTFAVETSVKSLSAGIPTSLNILVMDLRFDIQFDDYVELNIQQLKSLLGENLLIQQERIQINNTEAAQIVHESEMDDVFSNPQNVVFTQYLILDGRTQYVLTFGTVKDLYNENQDDISNIAQSFEITP